MSNDVLLSDDLSWFKPVRDQHHAQHLFEDGPRHSAVLNSLQACGKITFVEVMITSRTSELDALKRLQTETAAELDQSFKGEL